MSTRSKIRGAFHGLRPNPKGSALPSSCFRRPHNDAASFTSCCGPPSCSTPLRTRHFGRPRGVRYRGPWRLPGPDLHRLVVVSLSLGYVMVAPSHSWRPELLDARDFRGIDSICRRLDGRPNGSRSPLFAAQHLFWGIERARVLTRVGHSVGDWGFSRASNSRKGELASLAVSSRLSALDDPDDRLSRNVPVRGKRGRRFGKRAYRTDDRLEASVPEPLSEVSEPGAVGFDDEEHGAPVLRLDRGCPYSGDERAAGAH